MVDHWSLSVVGQRSKIEVDLIPLNCISFESKIHVYNENHNHWSTSGHCPWSNRGQKSKVT